MIFFSIIIPNYNHGKYLDECILSVLNQTYKNFELVILDDNSADNSRDIINKYKEHPLVTHVVFNEVNSGSPFPQWKKGIELAKADWIWMAESDDKAEPSFLEEAAAIIQDHPSIGCYYTDSAIMDETAMVTGKASDIRNVFFETKKWSVSYQANGRDELNECLKFLCTLNNSSALVFKKEIFTACRDEVISYRYYGDWFFQVNALLQTDIYYNHKALSSYRNHPANFISNKAPLIETKKEYFRLLMFLISKPEITQKKEVIRFFCLHYLGSGWIKEGMGNAVTLFKLYFKMNRSLALKVVPRLLWYKLIRRKNKKLYP
jgi:glycosyltransferase involved in cell wall biosynthesis